MKQTEIKIYKSVILTGILGIMFIGLLSRCSNIVAPQGGPIDSLPPKVVSVTPGYGTTNFKEKRIFWNSMNISNSRINKRNFSPPLL